MKDFSQKVALISGAGSGIGRFLSIELETSCNLVPIDWNKESLEETKRFFKEKNIAVSTHNAILATKKKYKLCLMRLSNFINK